MYNTYAAKFRDLTYA